MTRYLHGAALGALILMGSMAASSASADTLQDALAKAYQTSPRLQAEQARVRAVDEQVALALSNWRPNVTGTLDYGRSQRTRVDAVNGGDVQTPRSAALEVAQPVFRGFRTVSSVRAAKNQVSAAVAGLQNAEQQLLLETATAYMNVYRDQAVLDLNRNNEDVLRRQLEAAQDRLRVGEVTRTDVSQAESRLARATADRIQAEGNLEASKANYTRLVGDVPQNIAKPDVKLESLKSLDETVQLAEGKNPLVTSALYTSKQADNLVTNAEGALLPQVDVVGRADRGWEQSFVGPRKTDDLSVVARMTIPLYTGGADYARTREAKQTASQRLLELEESKRRARESAVQAWQQLATARAAIVARRAQVTAAELALEGAKQEAAVGTRTTLDVLDAEQEFLDARVNLVSAERDETVAIFNTRAAVGQMTAQALALPVPVYDPDKYYEDNKDKLIGLGD